MGVLTHTNTRTHELIYPSCKHTCNHTLKNRVAPRGEMVDSRGHESLYMSHTHKYIHIHTHSLSRSLSLSLSLSLTHTHKHTQKREHTHTLTNTHTQTHTQTHTHTHTHTHIYPRANTHMNTLKNRAPPGKKKEVASCGQVSLYMSPRVVRKIDMGEPNPNMCSTSIYKCGIYKCVSVNT